MNNISKSSLTLGIDIGGTNTLFGAVDASGNIIVRGEIPTTGYPSFHDFILSLHSAVASAMEKAAVPYSALGAIGVGAPCISPETGVIEGAVNLPWPSPLPLTDELQRIFHLPAAGENDANVAALGEKYYGIAKNLSNFIMLTLGTGVGSAIICDDHLLHGKKGFAGELGHTHIRRGKEARPCNCGQKGCLDAYVSARGLVTTALDLISNSDLPSSLRDIPELDAKTIGLAAANGDLLALEAVKTTGRLLGEACADFAAYSSPEAFIFFGGVANSFPLFKDAMIAEFNKNCLSIFKNKIQFLHSTLHESDAALLGTAAVGRSILNKPAPTKLEICTGDPEGVLAAIEGGADRVELCSGLAEGGLTPSAAMIRFSSKRIPTNVLIRPRAGDFIYSEEELNVMESDIRMAVDSGAAGIVVGALTLDGNVDMDACRRLIKNASSLDNTFHRAFDMTSDPFRALEDIISLGFKRILTSGQANSALEGAQLIAELKKRAAGRIIIMAGAGVTPDNAAELLSASNADEIHASARSRILSSSSPAGSATMGSADAADGSRMGTDPRIVAQIKDLIK